MYKILVPYNFDDASKNALRQAGIIAAKKKAKVEVFHVIEIGNEPTFTTQGFNPADSAREAAIIKLVEKLKLRMNDEVPTLINMQFLGGIKVKAAHYDLTLIDLILDRDADLIVMGSKGFKGSKELFVSSITQKTVDQADVPVIVVKEDTPISGFDRIVYASHFQETHQKEMDHLAEFLDGLDADINLIKVDGNDSVKPELKERLVSVSKSLQFNEANASADVVKSKDVEEAVERYMEKKRADMLTINAHNIAGLGRFFGDHIVEHVVNKSHHPVMLLNTDQ